ncbi:MAG: hypothetical protein K6G26_13655, partial [Lachnospiraceae bacterium]|nr:hypothetical protein [Lachnospiraceae bacterium]
MYKISKYTYMFENETNELLFYNTANGIKSCCKISNQDLIKKIKLNKLDTLDNKIMDDLYRYGILVNEEDDELEILNKLYLDIVGNNVLTLIITPTQECNFRCTYCY